MSARILLVEDEPLTAHAIAFVLRRESYQVEVVCTGTAAIEAVAEHAPDLVVLDLILPGPLSGMDVCRRLRRGSNVPIVILSARAAEADMVLAFECGADDYVVKPFSLPELLGRISARLRRCNLEQIDAPPPRRVGDLELDLARREVSVAGTPVELTQSEFDLLALLSETPGSVVARHDIVARLWSSDYVGDMRSCDAHVARIRRKIEDDPRKPTRLVSVRGVGYRLEAAE